MGTFLFFWTGEPCNEVLRTKRSDFREKILREGVTNFSMYIIILKNPFGNKTSSQGSKLFYFYFSGQIPRPRSPAVLHGWSKSLSSLYDLQGENSELAEEPEVHFCIHRLL